MRAREFSEAEVAPILQSFSQHGLLLSGGIALNFFLPQAFRKKRHDDIDLIFPCKHFTERELRMLNKIAHRHGLTSFRELSEHTAQQPRRRVFEAINRNERLIVHVEITDLTVPAKDVRIPNTKIAVKLPDINYLFARLLYAASSPTRTWHRRLDDVAYLCNLIHFCKRDISRKKVLSYLRKLCAGSSEAKQRRANFAEALRLAGSREIAARVAKTRSKEVFDYERAKYALKSFGMKGDADLRVTLSKKLYYLPRVKKEALCRAFGVKSYAELLKVLGGRSTKLSDAELARTLNKKPKGFIKRFLPKRR